MAIHPKTAKKVSEIMDSIGYTVDDGVAILTLNRPDQLNSFNAAMRRALNEAIDKAVADEAVRCLLITGAGRGFCAGQDLGERKPLPNGEKHDLSLTLDADYNPLMRKLDALEKPIVCAVNGVAAGAGVSLALSSDICFASEKARFILSFVNIGLAPDCGATWILPRLIGPQRALAFALSGEAVPARQAEQWGMIWQCVGEEELMPTALAFAKNLATKAPGSLGAIRQAMRAAWRNSLSEQLDLERDTQQRLGYTDDYGEGVTAFRERRTPRFAGR